jgi:DNA helicase-4
MINQAAHYVYERQYLSPYKYILVDEFQDLSQSRYRARACVGDDWQSIYRFAGSEISHMTHLAS